MKTYSTYEGARRAAKKLGDHVPIIRILNDPDEVWVVAGKGRVDIMVFPSEPPIRAMASITLNELLRKDMK